MGIGAASNTLLSELGTHKDLGVHTEMFSNGILPLLEKGDKRSFKKNIRVK